MATAPTPKPIVPSAKFDTEFKAGATIKAMTAAAAKGAKGEPFMAPLDAIRVFDGFNVRVTDTPAFEELMAELVNSIVANGFYQHKPLGVFVAAEGDDNLIYVKDGHRRFEAVQRANKVLAEAGKPTIDALPVVASPAAPLEDMLIEMAQSNTGAPLTMFEKGLLAQRLVNANMAKEDIAARLSMTPRHLNNVLLIANSPAKLRDLIVSDKVTATTAMKLMKDPKTAATKAAEMVKASEARGKTKAQPKDAGPKMQKSDSVFEFTAGQSIKDTLQSLAGFVREHVGHGDDDVILAALGNVKIVVSTPAPAPEPKAEAEAKPAAAKKAPAEKKAPAARRQGALKKTAEQAKADAKAHLSGEPKSDDLAGL